MSRASASISVAARRAARSTRARFCAIAVFSPFCTRGWVASSSVAVNSRTVRRLWVQRTLTPRAAARNNGGPSVVLLAPSQEVMLSSGTGSEIMQRIAAPMVGGMLTAPLLSMFVIPAAYKLMRRRVDRKAAAINATAARGQA